MHKNGAGTQGTGKGARDKPYYYRPSHSPPSAYIDGERQSRKRTVLLVTAVLLLTAAIIGFVLFGFFTSYFDLKSIEVKGLSGNSREEIIELSGIAMGEKLYSIDAKAAEQNILEAYPIIADVTVKKKLPDSVCIALTYDTPKYFIKVTGEYYTISEKLRVLERGGDRKALEGADLVYVEMPNIRRAVTGERLEFFRGDEEYIEPFLSAFEKSTFAGDVDRIYIENKFDISLVKVGKYRIEMGDFKDQLLKMKMAEKVLDAGGYRELEGVVLNVSDVSESSAFVNKTLKIE